MVCSSGGGSCQLWQHWRVRRLVVLSISLALAAGCGKKKKEKADEAGKPTATAPGEKPPVEKVKPPKSIVAESYPDTVNGLRDMMADLVRAHQRSPAKAQTTAESKLALQAPEAWFTEHFGEAGKHLLSEYKIYGHGFAEFPRMINDQGSKYGRKTFVVDRISTATDSKATGFQARALEAMKKPVPLYTFRLRGEGKSDFVLYSFIHDGATFRYVGRMARLDGKLPANHKDLDMTAAELAAKKAD